MAIKAGRKNALLNFHVQIQFVSSTDDEAINILMQTGSLKQKTGKYSTKWGIPTKSNTFRFLVAGLKWHAFYLCEFQLDSATGKSGKEY